MIGAFEELGEGGSQALAARREREESSSGPATSPHWKVCLHSPAYRWAPLSEQ